MKRLSILNLFFVLAFLQGVDQHHINKDNSSSKQNEKNDTDVKKDSKKENKNSFANNVKDMKQITGLFNIFYNEDKNLAYLEVKSNQFNELYMCNMTRQSGDGMMFDGGSMLSEFVFYFNKVGQNIQLINKNLGKCTNLNYKVSKPI